MTLSDISPSAVSESSTHPTLTHWPLETCVWELTLACDARCLHCGSSAGQPRRNELDTSEALALIGELSELGCRSVTFSGGEPLLRRDWPTLAQEIRRTGMVLEMITNGLSVCEQADRIADCGFFAVSFSVDGPREIHDRLRGIPGGLARLLEGAKALRERGVRIGAVTQINQINLNSLDATLDLLATHGFQGWQVQLTTPHGRAREHGDTLCLKPEDLPNLEDKLLALKARAPLFMLPADNIGYLSRREPRLLATPGQPERCWGGCAAGRSVVGITSDGTMRGCLSLPPLADEGNLRQARLTEVWRSPRAFAYNRCFRKEDLCGSCTGCVLGPLCRGGCQSQALAFTGAFHNNPYCLARLTYLRESSP